jgi:hypothetical protein
MHWSFYSQQDRYIFDCCQEMVGIANSGVQKLQRADGLEPAETAVRFIYQQNALGFVSEWVRSSHSYDSREADLIPLFYRLHGLGRSLDSHHRLSGGD